ncbi:MAG: carbonic anhydrase, partial [Planctomycetota bacterium]
LEQLRQGNKRFLDGEMIDRDWSHQRDQTRESQHPMAALLGCIDSRVPAELVFDVGIGDVFSVRVAGNVVNGDILGSLEYAAKVAKVNLIVVLGHTGCGAVTAACTGARLGHVTELVQKIEPIAAKTQAAMPGYANDDPTFVDAVAKQNVMHVLEEIPRQSAIIAELIEEGKLDLVGGLYRLKDGHVDFFGGLAKHLEEVGEPSEA